MEPIEVVCLRGGLGELGSVDELESRLESATCVEIDVCFAQYCWQFAAGYGCSTVCAVQCAPFNGCEPYCYE
jgi:hypothetical protein